MDNTSGQVAEPETNQQQAALDAQKNTVIRLLIAVGASILFFSLVSPTAVPLVMLVVGFVMLGVLFYGVLQLILLLTGLQKRLQPLQRRSIMLLGVCLPLLLIMLQSIGQLTLRDTLTLGGLFVVGVFYVLRLGRKA